MLSTRIPRTVTDDEIEKRQPHKMSLVMKIEASIRHYVILKTELSLATGMARDSNAGHQLRLPPAN